jgi:hypothetical protein
MRNAIKEQMNAVEAAVAEQENRIANELNSAFDNTNCHMVRFNTDMESVRKWRMQADELQAKAIRELDTAIGNNLAVQIGIVQQIADGRMVTGSDTPVIPARKPPKLVKAAEGGAA